MDKNTIYNDIRSKYYTAKKTKELAKECNLKFRYGYFSRREIELAQDAVDEFLEARDMSLQDLEEHLMNGAAFPYHELLQHVTAKIPNRTFKSVDTFVAWFYNPLTEKKFDKETEIQLLELVEQKGYRWKEIAQQLNFVRDACRTRYMELKSLSKNYVTVGEIEEIVRKGEVPTTEKEWEELSRRLNTTKKTLQTRITKFFKLPLKDSQNDMETIVLVAYILSLNFYCSIDINVVELQDFLANSSTIYKAERDAQQKRQEAAGEGVPAGNAYRSIFEDHFLKLFRNMNGMDLSVELSLDDIYWSNITRNFMVFSTTARSKFYSLVATYHLRTYKDLYDLLEKLAYNYYLISINRSLFS